MLFIYLLFQRISISHSLEGHTSNVTCLNLVDEYIWSGSFDTNILIWNPKTRLCVGEVSGEHKGKITAIAQSGDTVWTSSEDNMLCIWKL